jgi:hypothetical protein
MIYQRLAKMFLIRSRLCRPQEKPEMFPDQRKLGQPVRF